MLFVNGLKASLEVSLGIGRPQPAPGQAGQAQGGPGEAEDAGARAKAAKAAARAAFDAAVKGLREELAQVGGVQEWGWAPWGPPRAL